jgi:hypothetical protein
MATKSKSPDEIPPKACDRCHSFVCFLFNIAHQAGLAHMSNNSTENAMQLREPLLTLQAVKSLVLL